jgi:hypothetical protein
MTLFEPHFGPDSPTWDFLPHFFGYVERASRFLSRGRPGAEIAVLMNSRAFWANASDRDSAAVAHYAVSRELESMNCDFDFVEDRDIASAELTAGGRIRIGAMEYGAIVLPDATWMLPKSKETLARFKAAGGIVAHGPGELAKVPRTLRVDGDGARAIRVMKRIDGDGRVWFLMNEDMSPQEVEIEFPGAGPIVRYDPEQDAFEGVTVCPGRRLLRTFRPGETSIYITGANVAAALPPSPSGTSIQLSTGWTLRPLVSHVAGADDFEIVACTDPERATSLGDWRPVLGETFCGKVRYRVEFEVGEACNAIVDLGEVKWCAALSLNGTEIGSRFFGPFLWEVHLSKGRNVLEVTIANLLANQVGCDAVRDRILRDWQPNGSYDIHMRPFDKCNHESGLFGPVMVHCSRDISSHIRSTRLGAMEVGYAELRYQK